MVFVLGTSSFRKIFVIFAYSTDFVGFYILFTVSLNWALLWSFDKNAIKYF